MKAPRFEIWLIDHLKRRFDLLEEALWFQYARITNTMGWFQVALPSDFPINSLRKDYLLEFWRAPEGGSLRRECVGFLRKPDFDTSSGGIQTVIVNGPDVMDLLDRRIVAYAAGSSGALKSGAADDLMKEVVCENMGIRLTEPAAYISEADFSVGRPTGTDGFDVISPATTHTVLESLAEFDAIVDVDGDLTASAAAVKIGTFGFNVDFDNATGAFGVINATAVDRTQGDIDVWFDKNDLALESGGVINFVDFNDGGPATNWRIQLVNSAGTLAVRTQYRTDAGAIAQVGNNVVLPAGYCHMRFVFKRSSGAGNDDGYAYFYVDDGNSITIESATGLDNDTKDWDTIRVGMSATNSTTFGGSFHFDEVRVTETISPVWTTEAAALSGDYGVAFTLEDTTARYGTLDDAANDPDTIEDALIGLTYLDMATNDEMAVITAREDVGAVDAARLILGKSQGNHYIYGQARLDSGAYVSTDHALVEHGDAVRIVLVASSAAGANDGILLVMRNQQIVAQLQGLDNDTMNVDTVRYGVPNGVPVTTGGILVMDRLRAADTFEVCAAPEARQFPIARFRIQPDASAGPTISMGFARRKVIDVLSDMADASRVAGNEVFFDIVPGETGEFEFQTKIIRPGVDHTYPDGKPPIILSLERGNLSEPRLLLDSSNEENFIYAAGQGTGEDREVQTAEDTDLTAMSPWARREGFVDARNLTETASIQDSADRGLAQGRPRRLFSARILDAPGARYGSDWGLGDEITAFYAGYRFNCLIRSVHVAVNGEGYETVDARLEADEPQ